MKLEANTLSYRYRRSRWIISNVNFSVDSGEIIGLLGPSGQGKSTFAKLLAGYLKPAHGCVTIDGGPIPRMGHNPVQLIFQHPEKSVNPRWKMSETLREGWTPSQEVMEALGLRQEWMARYPNELSGGELQRFCVARALGPGTGFLICDEITTMVDAVTQADIWNFLIRYAKKHDIGILMITHSRSLANVICNRVEEFSELSSNFAPA
jgi:peptide/nickel transport system ATP-binding protein